MILCLTYRKFCWWGVVIRKTCSVKQLFFNEYGPLSCDAVWLRYSLTFRGTYLQLVQRRGIIQTVSSISFWISLVLLYTVLLVCHLLKHISCLPSFLTQKMEPICSLRNVGFSPSYMQFQPLMPTFYSRHYVTLKVILFARSKLYLFLGKLVWFLRSPFCPRPLVGRFFLCWILDPKKTLYIPRTLFIDGELSTNCKLNECWLMLFSLELRKKCYRKTKYFRLPLFPFIYGE